MTVLDNRHTTLLKNMIKRSGVGESDKRRSTIINIGDEVNEDYQGVDDFANRYVDKLNQTGKRHLLKNLVEYVGKSVGEDHSDSVHQLRQALEQRKIHIITGTKGGVGKTLISLAIAAHYDNPKSQSNPLLCVDLNTTNPDLYRILSYYEDNNITNQTNRKRGDWTFSKITDRLHAMRLDEPYLIRGGAASFWDYIDEVVKNPDYKDFDVLIDTSNHVSNLILGRHDYELNGIDNELLGMLPRDIVDDWTTIVRDTLNNSGFNCTIYVWVFWTWASFQDDQISSITNAIGSFAELNRVNSQTSLIVPRINILHVLNPSALAKPEFGWENDEEKRDIDRNIGKLHGIQDNLENIEFEPAEREAAQSNVEHLMGLFERRKAQKAKETSQRFFQNFKEECSPLPYIYSYISDSQRRHDNSPSFMNTVVPIFTEKYDKDKMAFEQLEKVLRYRRPTNILPISELDPTLRGYTEVFSRSRPHTFAELTKYISAFVEDVTKFLPKVTPGFDIVDT